VTGSDKPNTDKPATDKPATGKPATGKPSNDKPVVGLPTAHDKLDDYAQGNKPGTKPVTDTPTDKPATGKPATDKPATGKAPDPKQPVDPGLYDKTGRLADRPVSPSRSERDRLAETPRTEVAMDKDKSKPTSGSSVAGRLAQTNIERKASDAALCQLYTRKVEAGGKLRLKVPQGTDTTQVLLEDEPLTITRRDARTWVVAIAPDAKSGRVTLKDGDDSVACGRIEVQ
jgi:hypothetical protein